MSSFACCVEGCGGIICFSPEIERRLRETHEFWLCPFGHEQHFAKETPKDIEIRLAREARDRFRGFWEEVEQTFGTCPFGCGWRSTSGIERRWMSMLRHFEKEHQAMAEGTPMLALFFESRRSEAA